MATTIRDIAKLAGVSISTVSRVISDSPRISDETKKRIREILKETNYVPNSTAKQLVMKSNFNIGFLFNSHSSNVLVDFYFYNMIGGLQSVVLSNNYELTICDFSYLDPSENLLERFVYNRKVDGVILHVSMVNAEIISKLNEIDFPYVIIGNPNIDIESTWVDFDNTTAGELACERLYERGYKKVAFIAGSKEEVISNQRIEGYKKCLKKLKVEVDPQYIINTMGTDVDGYESLKKLLSLESPPDAVISINNYTAFGAIRAINELSIKVPEELGVIAFDNFPLAPYISPALTSIDIDTFKLGERASELLMEKVKNSCKHHKYEKIVPNIILRVSDARK
ncbi:LacI family DNA-binding transcriptional regulator [Clostridium thermarum]|uniref:LacI family DNA-binding transcriptional regulator n=1 Tax=Clostridium thermarum TaxID=1716543 RepID=UPI00111D913F|nr:LacI family DNA-binding transcriptional regulator [Clostridium thermarum]